MTVSLAEFRAVRLSQQRHRKAIGFLSRFLADQLNPGRDVAPLILTGYLQRAALVFMQPPEIHRLHQHV